jgi:hypothetical protein
MTCDDAFDQLTTPAGANDPRLAAHLAHCTRCRAMAETLAPAIELFGEPVVPTAPKAGSTAATIARKAAERLTHRAASPRRLGAFVRRNVPVLAAAFGGAACCLLAIRLNSSEAPAAASAMCPRKSPVATEWMERHALPVAMACIACHPTGGPQLVMPPLTGSRTSLGGAL